VEFNEWLDALRVEALAQGISEETLNLALADLEPSKRVVELDRNQPEFKKDFWTYLDLMVNDLRISKGRRMLHRHHDLLAQVQERYGVQPRFLVAIWGLETNFGSNLGGFPVINSVATLAYDDRRSSFFRAELLHALKIIDEGHIEASNMQGSWAGAMGQLQFMPSTFISFAVDEDGDGRKDIWSSLPDVFASAANFLSKYGWNDEYTWGRKVKVPQGLDENFYGMDRKKLLREWQEIGVRRINEDHLPEVEITASLIRPTKGRGPSFLVYQNYRAIMRWNRSHLYALAVCYLADRLAGI
jgi:membrane-bound lytic murein transglycosylase B